MSFHYDPETDKRSLMLQQKVLCNGQKTGRVCTYYWAHVEKVESANSDNLRRGELFRACSYPGGGGPIHCHEMAAEQLATECNQYQPRLLPLWKRPLAAMRLIEDPGLHDPFFENYDPMTPEEIRELQRLHPSVEPDPSAVVGAASIGAANIAAFKQELSIVDAMDALDKEEN